VRDNPGEKRKERLYNRGRAALPAPRQHRENDSGFSPVDAFSALRAKKTTGAEAGTP
jgi:hypothetical protein